MKNETTMSATSGRWACGRDSQCGGGVAGWEFWTVDRPESRVKISGFWYIHTNVGLSWKKRWQQFHSSEHCFATWH